MPRYDGGTATAADGSASTPGVPAPLLSTLTSDSGPEFCRYLRTIYYTELRHGYVTEECAAADSRLLELALILKLVRRKGDVGWLRLTPLGYEVANFAKEYSNWVDAGRTLPDGVTSALVTGKRVLDAGCSFGRHLTSFTVHGADGVGIDFQDRYLRLSRAFAVQEGVVPPRVLRACVERLPFRSRSFDVVFCRLVLNYSSDVDSTLAEFGRVLAPDGVLVLTVDPFNTTLRNLFTNAWIGNGRATGFVIFGLLNTMCLQLTGRQIILRRAGRMHARQSPTWPTERWLMRRLARHGFVPFAGDSYRHPEVAGSYRARIRVS